MRAILALLIALPAVAQEKPAGSSGQAENRKKPATDAFKDRIWVTKAQVTVDGRPVTYEARAGALAVKTDDGKPWAEMFFVAYTQPQADPHTRPLMFCFNGGPGSSSVWLHMGMLGPRRAKVPSDASYPAPPYRAVENPSSLVDKFDLVFIDPVSTGYSRPAPDVKKSEFHGYDEDLQSVGEFIHLYLQKFNRWSSPLYLCGESYGTTRAAGLSGYLLRRYNINLNGIVLVSAVLDFATIRFSKTNDLPYALFLPTYTATAWYHKKLPPDLQRLTLEEAVAQSEEYVHKEYVPALFQGTNLTEEQRRRIAEQVARLTGLTRDYVLRADLRINMGRFGKELLRDRGLTIGRFDGRYVGRDRDSAGESYEHDASGAAIFAAYTACLNDYLRRDLKVNIERTYEILTGKVHPWNYSRFENRYVESSETLRSTLMKNPSLRIFVANGYFDLATPHFATEYTMAHMALPEADRNRITMKYYPAGHMMYVHEPSLQKLRSDLIEFLNATYTPPSAVPEPEPAPPREPQRP